MSGSATVPTQAAFDALTARVAALEAIKPPSSTPSPTPTPTPPDSADLTVIPPATVVTAGGITYTLVSGRVYVGGALVVTAQMPVHHVARQAAAVYPISHPVDGERQKYGKSPYGPGDAD